MKIPLHVAILAIFMKSLKENYIKSNELVVDVESHGRVVFDENMDISRVVGWHTSTFPLFLDIQESSLVTDVISQLDNKFNQVSHSGVAYGLNHSKMNDIHRPSSNICFNFLGNTDFNSKGLLDFKPSLYSFGNARHSDNNRGYEIKLTGKITHDCLLLDTSFSNNIGKINILKAMEDIKKYFMSIIKNQSNYASLFYEKGTRTGKLNYAPKELMNKLFLEEKRDYKNIFITGVTGFIGAYVLKDLLDKTESNLHCLIRAKDTNQCYEKLNSTFNYYFPEYKLNEHKQRLFIHCGDVGEDKFGLNAKLYVSLSHELDSIYHFAADTRLIGDKSDFSKTNLNSVRNCLEFASFGKKKDIHYMSTLAVSGVNTQDELKYFSEDDLDINQEFQNHYEETKFNAEKLLNSYKDKLNIFIYRSGNVTGSYIDAKFQKNPMDNRLIQFLTACSKIQKLPIDLGENVVFSQVDIVAKAIVEISLNHICKPNVYHVDSPYSISMKRIFEAMKKNNFSFTEIGLNNFYEVFKEHSDTKDKIVSIGRFWVNRGGRNVKYKNDKTLQLLQFMQIEFVEVNDYWLNQFIKNIKFLMHSEIDINHKKQTSLI